MSQPRVEQCPGKEVHSVTRADNFSSVLQITQPRPMHEHRTDKWDGMSPWPVSNDKTFAR